MKDVSDLKSRLVAEAQGAGFATCRVTTPDAIPHVPERLAAFLAEGRHGQMDWLADRAAWRGSPRALWPEARSVIMLAEPYTPTHNPLEDLRDRQRGVISVYARGKDYHDVCKKRLKRVARWLVAEAAC
ncbi:MAG: QueG-associated DUF1730 domain-containing protein, partial [Pseudomonadota bacterium]